MGSGSLKLFLLDFLFLFLVFFFLLSTIYNNSNFTNLSLFQTSSYIWTIGALVLGTEIVKYFRIHLSSYDIFFSTIGLFAVYIFSTKGISENRQNFILNFTDKFEYAKGSDILLAFVFVFVFILNKLNYSVEFAIDLLRYGSHASVHPQNLL